MTDSLADGYTDLERLDGITMPLSILLSLSILLERYGSVLWHWILARGGSIV